MVQINLILGVLLSNSISEQINASSMDLWKFGPNVLFDFYQNFCYKLLILFFGFNLIRCLVVL